jgi:hypothetical protein
MGPDVSEVRAERRPWMISFGGARVIQEGRGVTIAEELRVRVVIAAGRWKQWPLYLRTPQVHDHNLRLKCGLGHPGVGCATWRGLRPVRSGLPAPYSSCSMVTSAVLVGLLSGGMTQACGSASLRW